MSGIKETCICESSIDYKAECERLSMIIMRQKEEILALKKACFGLSDALMQEGWLNERN